MPDPTDGIQPIPVMPLPVEPIPVELLGVDPLPVEAIPVDPVPVEPVPVDLSADDGGALPVEVLADPPRPPVGQPPPLPPPPAWPSPYAVATAVRSGPPGLVRTLGVCSIVVASLGLVGGGLVTMANLFAFAVSSAQASAANAAAAKQAAATAATTTGPAEVVGIGGMAAAVRSAVAEGLNQARPLSTGQLAQLDELLADDGQAVVSVGEKADAALIAAGVTASGAIGTLRDAEVAGPANSYYVLANGRLEVGEDHAVFFPTGNQPPVRAMAYDLPPLPADAAAPPLLGDDALRSILRTIARDNGGRPKAAQVKGIVDLLRSPTQQVIVPTDGTVDPAIEVSSANTGADGTLTVQTQHGIAACDLEVTSAGQVSASLASTVAAKVPPPNATAYRAVVLTSLGQLGLAAFLLVIGILTVRQNRLGGRLHWAWVAAKLPLGIGAVLTTGWLWRSLGFGATVSGGGFTPWMIPALVGLIYPVVLAFVLSSRSVRAYYRAVT